MADIDNLKGGTKRVVEESSLDNLRGGTKRVIQVNSLDNLRGGTKRVYIVGGGGSSAVIDPLNVTPSTSAQTITASGGVDGYSPVNVSAVDASIDANITAGNIKKDVSILGVTGTYEGQTPTGTMYIISNGTYNVADKAIANVNVPTTAPAHYIEKTVDANGKLQNSTNIINLNGVTDVGDYALYGAYSRVAFPANTSVDLSALTTISGNSACYNMFQGCTGLTSVDLSSLTTISGGSACQNMFNGCRNLVTIDLSSLTTIAGTNSTNAMFTSCDSLQAIYLPSLTTINTGIGLMFHGCSALTTVEMNALNIITADLGASYSLVFSMCGYLESVEFGGLTASTFASKNTQLQYLFSNTTGTQTPNGCTVHFPSNLDPSDPDHTFDASTLAGYPTFGGNASYIHVAFDLLASE